MRFMVMATLECKKNEVLGEVTDCGEDRRTPQEPQKNIEKRNFEFCARSSHEHHHVVSYYLHPYFGSLVLRHPFTLECRFLTHTAAIMTVQWASAEMQLALKNSK